jgi:lysophospholipase L1-like esterase
MSRALSQRSTLQVPSESGIYNRSGLPTNVGLRTRAFDKPRSLYNVKGTNTFAIKAALASALNGDTLETIMFAGDSKTAGFGTNAGASINGAKSMPGWFRQLMAARGYSVAGTGLVFCNQNPGSGTGDTRWTFTGTWTSTGVNVNFASSIVTGSTATFTSDVAGTVVEIWSLSNSGPFTYAIDGGSAVSVTPSGSNTTHLTTVSGLANTTHTVVITTTSTTNTYVLACNVRKTTGLQVTNNAICGSTSSNWTTGTWYNSNNIAKLAPASAFFISLGTNDARTGVTVASYYASMSTLVSGQIALGRQGGIIVPSPTSTVDISATLWNQYVSAMYDLADAYDLPLVDLTDVYGTYAAANAKGLFFDSLHEKEKGYGVNAAAVIGAFVA